MKAFKIAAKAFKENFRDKKRLAMLLLFPIMFMLVFGLMFRADIGENYPHTIAVFNDDSGVVLYINNTTQPWNFGDELVDVLNNMTYDDSVTHVFEVLRLSEEDAQDKLVDREVHAICRIESGFSAAVGSLVNSTVRETITLAVGGAVLEGRNVSAQNLTIPNVDPSVTSLVIIEGDVSFSDFGVTQSILSIAVDEFVQGVVAVSEDRTIASLPPDIRHANWEYGGTYVSSRVQPVPGTETFVPFDYIAPGLLVFASLIVSGSVASDLAREVEKKTLERLQISRMKSFDLLFGTIMPWTVIGAIQLLVLLAFAIALGFQWQGGPTAILVAMLVAVIAGIASAALGLLIAAFSKSESHAGTLGPIVWVPLGFAAGAFIVTEPNIIQESLPWGQAVLTLRNVLTFGEGLDDVWMNIALIAVQTIIVFIIGVVAFSMMRLKAR